MQKLSEADNLNNWIDRASVIRLANIHEDTAGKSFQTIQDASDQVDRLQQSHPDMIPLMSSDGRSFKVNIVDSSV
jgi:hypothetical protein